ncbi:MAG: phosphoglycerate kinase [Candidatus Jorgensenbacteria bacterium]|nr:phosphoglycerate kinase [Candidatus Jorgensenbacteria bacterium]
MIRFLTPAVLKRHRGTTCLLRVDFNVEPGAEDTTNRVDTILPTIRLLLQYSVKVVILSHRGRPTRREGTFSLKPFAPILSRKLHTPVRFIPGTDIASLRGRLAGSRGKIALIENLRFFKGEEENSTAFARRLSSLSDFYVNDAFAVAHRTHASVVAITKFLPSYGGLRLKEELARLDEVMKSSRHPFVVIVGGAKVGDKLRSLRGLLRKADVVLLGSSVFNEKNIPNLPKLSFPDDIKAHGNLAWDIGPWTMKRYAKALAGARTIIWNGPVGFYEKSGFEAGTKAMWRAILSASRRKPKPHIIVGGGETVASLKDLHVTSRVPKNIFISTGGGAMLAYLAGEKLPGLEALK